MQSKTRPIILAPMAGVTDSAYRQTALRYGADFCCTEMISAKALRFKSSKTLLIGDIPKEEKPAIIQLFGREPEDFSYAISFLQERQPDKILCFDINMGCPAPKIARNGEGSALMLETELAARIVTQSKKVSRFPVTAKIRKGYSKEQENYLEFSKALQDAGLDGITLHGRFREDFYSGRADWGSIKKLKETLYIPVYGNGDIRDAASAAAMLKETNADGLMIGRAALGNPFVFSEIKAGLSVLSYEVPMLEERGRALFLQAELACAYKGERVAIQEMRKHAAWYIKGLPGAASLRNAATALATLKQLHSFVRVAFGYTQSVEL